MRPHHRPSVPILSSARRLLAALALLSMAALPLHAAPAADGALPEVRIRNLGQDQADVPFTFGQIVAPGQLKARDGVAGRLADGKTVALQADVKATHPDGSVRHMIVSGVLPRLAARQEAALQLVKADSGAGAARAPTPQRLLERGLDASVTVTIDGADYRASLKEALAGGRPAAWLAGPVASEWQAAAPLRNKAGAIHPLLGARFGVRWYPALEKQARVEVVLENTSTFKPGMRNLEYDVAIEIGGREVLRKEALAHYRHARWRHVDWWDGERAPRVHLRPDAAYLIASKAVPNYDQHVVPQESALAALAKQLEPAKNGREKTGPMTIGPVNPYMPTSGGRDDIGPLPGWSVMYLLSGDLRARDAMLAAAEGSGAWSIHLRDEKTGYPVRADSEANRRLSTHMNMAGRGPLPVPRCAGNDNSLCKTPYAHDTSHQPSLAYLPYLLTGEYYYLEELQFWAATNPLETAPENSGLGQGLVRWQQVRAQAWSLRTLGHAAYITPDGHPLKAYFNKQLDNNLAFYHATYVAGKPNRLGVYDGSGQNTFQVKGSAPWQDDFLTWSFGYLAELGFAKALPILRWKATYPVGRMTAPGYCWTDAAAYTLKTRPAEKAPVFSSFAELYQANFGGEAIRINDGKPLAHPNGSRYIDQPCASQAQADWIGAAAKRGWKRGAMTGYADSPLGYPANMQPALAVAATPAWNIPQAAEAWERFEGRAVKPDYGKAPQWAIIPR